LNIARMNSTEHSSVDESSMHRSWVGRAQQDEDFVSPSMVRALAATQDNTGHPNAGA